MKSSIEDAAALIRDADYVAALTGAGISTESGIPDFRGPQGVWTKNPEAEKLSNIRHYLADPEVRVASWRARLTHPALNAAPNPAHEALVELEQKSRLHTLVTQNIDGLHQKAGTSRDVLIEIHGTIHNVMCLSCGDSRPMTEALERVVDGEEDPPCIVCGGILKSATISFGQAPDSGDLERAFRAAERCDVLLAAGTSLSVYPIAHMVEIAVAQGSQILIFNEEPTPFDRVSTGTFHGKLSQTLQDVSRKV